MAYPVSLELDADPQIANMRSGRYFTRLSAYGYLLTDEYPALALD